MDIAIKPSKSQQVRLLKGRHPYLSIDDIAELTGFDRGLVEKALKARVNDRPKSRAS